MLKLTYYYQYFLNFHIFHLSYLYLRQFVFLEEVRVSLEKSLILHRKVGYPSQLSFEFKLSLFLGLDKSMIIVDELIGTTR